MNKKSEQTSTFKSDSPENFEKQNFNERRLAILIKQNVPTKKLMKQYEGVLNTSSDNSISSKFLIIKSKIQQKFYAKYSKESFEDKLSLGFATTIGTMVPDALKIPRQDKTFDLPYAVNMSILNLLNTTDNFYDFNCGLQIYFKYIEAYNYSKDSELPIAQKAVIKDGYADIDLDKELEYQEN